jgi:hypothetical protein
VSYQPYLESGALRQMHGLPEQAFDMLVPQLGTISTRPSSVRWRSALATVLRATPQC